MAVMTENRKITGTAELEFATFYLDDLLMGIDIQQVQEINHLLDVTPVPHVPEYVAGVVNLRGQVVTVLDLRAIVGLTPAKITSQSCNVIVNVAGEHIGMIVDRIADVVTASSDEIESAPANVRGIDGQHIQGVYKMDKKLLMVLAIDEMIQKSVGEQQNGQNSKENE